MNLRILLLISIAVGCATYTDDLREVRNSFRAGEFGEALSQLESSKIREQQRNRLLFLLEKSSILDRLQKTKQCRNHLLQADRLVDELYTVSVTKTAATFIYNDSASDYAGEDYEKVAIHTLLALSFLGDGILKSALVEARKINSRLNEINSKYEDKKNRYGEDAFARYLAGSIHHAKGDLDSAIVDYSRAVKIYESSYGSLFDNEIPRGLLMAYYETLLERRRRQKAKKLENRYDWLKKTKIKKSSGSLVVIHELGTIAVKQEHSFVFSISDQIVRLSFPKIYARSPYRFGKTGVTVAGKFYRADLAQNFDGIAAATLEDRRGRLILKHGARLLIKGQMVEQAEKKLGPLGGLAANVYGAVTESADTRSWTSLPSAIYVSRVNLAAGEHSYKILSGGKLSRLAKVSIKKGQTVFLRDSAL